MFSGGDQRRMSVDPSTQHVSENSGNMVSGLDIQNGATHQQAVSVAVYSKKLQDDLHEIGQKIKHHEDNVKYLNTLKRALDESIHDKQVALGKYDKANFFQTKEKDSVRVKNEEIIESILKHENTAAALLYGIKKQEEALSSDHSLTRDVIGIVATLGKIEDDNLSRVLSEYLGVDTMLAVVCKTHEGVKALEAYNREGLIVKNFGIHAFAASVGRPLSCRFTVICLEDIRTYAGDVIADDPQRRLALQKPRFPNGETPPGFLGFAVNMIAIDIKNLCCLSKDGSNLREKLFYHLLSNLQVYRSREEMLNALSCIRNGAISLDGGIIRSPGVFSLGHNQEDIGLKFPSGSKRWNIPESFFEIENEMKEAKWKMTRTMEDMQREQDLLNHARSNYEIKKLELLQYLAQSSLHVSQAQFQVGRGSTPR